MSKVYNLNSEKNVIKLAKIPLPIRLTTLSIRTRTISLPLGVIAASLSSLSPLSLPSLRSRESVQLRLLSFQNKPRPGQVLGDSLKRVQRLKTCPVP